MTAPEYLTTEEVAELLRTSPETVRFWRQIRKGPKSFKLGRRVLYAREDVDAYVAAARAGQAAAVQSFERTGYVEIRHWDHGPDDRCPDIRYHVGADQAVSR